MNLLENLEKIVETDDRLLVSVPIFINQKYNCSYWQMSRHNTNVFRTINSSVPISILNGQQINGFPNTETLSSLYGYVCREKLEEDISTATATSTAMNNSCNNYNKEIRPYLTEVDFSIAYVIDTLGLELVVRIMMLLLADRYNYVQYKLL